VCSQCLKRKKSVTFNIKVTSFISLTSAIGALVSMTHILFRILFLFNFMLNYMFDFMVTIINFDRIDNLTKNELKVKYLSLNILT
jgi:hypothetical protein